MRYGAPGGQHDDTVMALAMAWSAVSGQHRLVYPIADSEIVVKEFTIPEHWRRAFGLDIRWNTVAAIWGVLSGVFLILNRMCCTFTVNIAGRRTRLSTPLRFGPAGIGSRGSSIRRHMDGTRRMGFG